MTEAWPPTQRFTEALAYATEVHRGQSRKGTAVPWYYRTLVEAFRQPDRTPLTEELERVVSELEAERKRKLEGR